VSIAGQPHTVSQSAAEGTPAPNPPAPEPPPPTPEPPTPTPTPTPMPPVCTFVLSSTAVTVAPAGGSASVGVTVSDGCEWTASSADPWLTIVNGSSGNGAGSVQFTAAPNPSTAARTGALTIAGQSVAVTQGGATPVPVPSCTTFTLSSTSESVGASGGTISVSVTTQAGCEWTAASNVGWIEVTSASSGSGSAQVSFSVALNAESVPRSGTLTIAGQTVTVDQAAGPVMTTVTGEVSDLQGECPTLTFVVDGRRVRTDAATEFNKDCVGLKNKQEVSVEGSVEVDGTILATRVLR
jgi:Domain of unknown function (DUF5666)/Putative binding domain, N-terminal